MSPTYEVRGPCPGERFWTVIEHAGQDKRLVAKFNDALPGAKQAAERVAEWLNTGHDLDGYAIPKKEVA